MDNTTKDKCTLSNSEIVQRANELVNKLAKTGGKSWSLQVPVNFNRDPDMLFIELGKRLLETETRLTQFEEMKTALEKIINYQQPCTKGECRDWIESVRNICSKTLASLPTTKPSREQEYKTALEKIAKLDYDESKNINAVDRLIEVNFIARTTLKP